MACLRLKLLQRFLEQIPHGDITVEVIFSTDAKQ